MPFANIINNKVVMTAPGALPGFVEIAGDDARLIAFNTLRDHPTILDFNVFLNRMTGLEQMAISTAAQTNAQLLLWLTMGAGKGVVNLIDPATAAGLDVLVSAGIIDEARKATLLTP